MAELATIRDEHRTTLQQLRSDARQLFYDMNSDIEQVREQLYTDSETIQKDWERVYRQLTDAWQSNNHELLKRQAATKRELVYRIGMKKVKAQLETLRGQQTNISHQLRHDTAQAAAMVSLQCIAFTVLPYRLYLHGCMLWCSLSDACACC